MPIKLRNKDAIVITLPQPANLSSKEVSVGGPSVTLSDALKEAHKGIAAEKLIQVRVSPLSKDSHLESPPFSATFAGAAHRAFTVHDPLILKPDDLHILISQGVARFFSQYPEEFRADAVSFEGKKTLIRKFYYEPGCPPAEWNHMAENFAEAIWENSHNKELINAMMQKYSQSQPVDQGIKAVTLMATFSSYFNYTWMTMCFIPEFRLEGTEEDWKKLLELPDKIIAALTTTKVESMGEGKSTLVRWLNLLKENVLAECYKTRQGSVNDDFWLSFYKYKSQSGGNTISGHINYFYPFLYNPSYNSPEQIAMNQYMESMRKRLPATATATASNNLPDNSAKKNSLRLELNQYMLGAKQNPPTTELFPPNIVDVDVPWVCNKITYPLGVKAGLGALSVNKAEGISPVRFLSIFYKESPPSAHVPVDLRTVPIYAPEALSINAVVEPTIAPLTVDAQTCSEILPISADVAPLTVAATPVSPEALPINVAVEPALVALTVNGAPISNTNLNDISMMILSGFITAVGIVTISIAFALCNTPLGIAGIATTLAGIGLFASVRSDQNSLEAQRFSINLANA